MTFIVKKRCVRCRKVLRENGTCQNESCVLYVPEIKQEEEIVLEETKQKKK